MKTWIANHQLLAIFIGLFIIAGLIYLAFYLFNKYIKSLPDTNTVPDTTNDTTTDTTTNSIQSQNTLAGEGRGRIAFNITSGMGSGNIGSTAPSGGTGVRVSGAVGGGGVKH